jgi:hypothetical protein
MDPILFLDLIKQEREYQKSKGFSDNFDLVNKANDWVAYITAYAAKAFSTNPTKDTVGSEEFKKAMVKVATLAYAALSAHQQKC